MKFHYRNSSIERVHVERGIERLRRFKVMKFMSHHMYRHCNKLLIILSYTVNLFPPLIRDKNCTYDETIENEDELTNEEIDDILRQVGEEDHQDDIFRGRSNSV